MKFFKEDTEVVYNIQGLRGIGKIKGMSTVELPVIGISYMVEDMSGNFPSATYPYKTFACFEVWLEVDPCSLEDAHIL